MYLIIDYFYYYFGITSSLVVFGSWTYCLTSDLGFSEDMSPDGGGLLSSLLPAEQRGAVDR